MIQNAARTGASSRLQRSTPVDTPCVVGCFDFRHPSPSRFRLGQSKSERSNADESGPEKPDIEIYRRRGPASACGLRPRYPPLSARPSAPTHLHVPARVAARAFALDARPSTGAGEIVCGCGASVTERARRRRMPESPARPEAAPGTERNSVRESAAGARRPTAGRPVLVPPLARERGIPADSCREVSR